MNSYSNRKHPFMTFANLLTCFRFVSAPILLWLACHGYGIAFLLLLAVSFLTDVLDGIVARWTGEVSQFGAKLDSWADMVNYCTIALGSWWLWPEVVMREAFFVTLIVLSYLLPPLVGIIKFGKFTSYHTWSVKLAAASVGLSLYVLFLAGPSWPFRLAAIVCVVAATEEISITLTASELFSNVSSFWDVKQRLARMRNTASSKSDANS
ncbi:MAG: CDP-alcohol phosphatidyltransferase family protein [Methylococcaceae bacterium]|nr:CDP-alcohol phosphatidyltransferase family protein [Methylococcaceae bacterium]